MSSFKQQVERKRKLIEKHQRELAALLATCPHDEVEHRDHYYDGDYYNKAFTERIVCCAVCKKQTQESVRVTHDYYG